ncbi:hypothetical protein PanWU01x14_191160 [Parasponia andersonii]|uniref:Uncharacterized protein n=1 Tax=Parasponia andersonii TaxID=3476 RepID=A0A2P5C1T5_PARAD|nr:hypothetical protein PanWU01x14_191160 [Parasponia andersonii]
MQKQENNVGPTKNCVGGYFKKANIQPSAPNKKKLMYELLINYYPSNSSNVSLDTFSITIWNEFK